MNKIIEEINSVGTARLMGAFLLLLFTIVIMTDSSTAEQKMTTLKEFNVKYKLEGNVTGEKSHYSQDYGRVNCWVEVSEINMPGAPAQKKNEKVITYVKGDQQWIITINQEDNTGTKMKNPMYEGITAGMKGKSPKEFSEQFMTQMGGKVVGEKTINGEKCKQWELMGGAKACITDDQIVLENSVNMGPVSMKETAIKVERNNAGPKGICDVGDAKLKEMDMGQMLGQ